MNKKSHNQTDKKRRKVIKKHIQFRAKHKLKPQDKRKVLVVVIEIAILFLVLVLFSHMILQKSKIYSINALAVSNPDSTFAHGSTAKIYLWLKEGSGNVFIDTSPMSSIDLQASIRYSNKLACEFLEEDCSKYDFFYRVDTSSFMVSGPSASMAIAVLTVAALKDLPINDSVAVTGTINSGYLIGPVAGLLQKVQSTFETNIKTILIPFGQSIVKSENQTINLTEYGKVMGNKSVIEITSLYDALEYFTGKKFYEKKVVNVSDQKYETVMKEVANKLCDRTKSLLVQVNSSLAEDEESYLNLAQQFYNDSLDAMSKGNFYAAASFCFSANPRLLYLLLKRNPDEVGELETFVKSKIDFFDNNLLTKEAKTLGDLQIKGVVNSRVEEAKKELAKFENNQSDLFSLAYAFERIYSAVLWSKFYSLDTKQLNFDQDYLKKQCMDMIYELNSMKEFLKFYVPESMLSSINLDLPKKYFEESKYDLCLFESLKTRASLNVFNTYLFVDQSRFNETISEKLNAAFKEIQKQTAKGYFPIVAYSYYTYAKQLAEKNESSSAILFSEYALELSKMDLFLRKEKGFHFNFYIQILILGFILGYLFRDILRQV
ncbi:MAG: uncharacterized protein PWP03_313 [Candidatus Woesearchaeota archaeon]|nr:uncharacterized protein [Candidatus Woesearchaeota archaeon]